MRDSILWPGSFCASLGVFAGGWHRGAMSAVCRLESDPAVKVLNSLVSHSLVQVVPTVDGALRFRLLEIIRRFALDRLQDEGELELTRRFVEHMVSTAERAAPSLGTMEGPRWLTTLDAEVDNFRAVFASTYEWASEFKHRLAVSLVPYWFLRGLAIEGRGYLDQTISALAPDSPTLADALTGLSLLSWTQGDLETAARHARAAFLAGRRCKDRQREGYALLRLAQAQFDASRPATAARTTRQVQAIAADLRDERLAAESALQLGQVALVDNRLSDAERLVTECLDLFSRVGPAYRLANARVTLGRVYLHQGRSHDAEKVLVESLTVVREFAMVRPVVPILESLAALAAARGNYVRAGHLWGAAAGLIDRLGARPPPTAPMRLATVERVRASLSSAGGARAFAEGRQMELTRAVAYAIGRPSIDEAAHPREGAKQAILTPRQMQVAKLVARGLTYPEIAELLRCSTRTVQRHVEDVKDRLGIRLRHEIGEWVRNHYPDG